LYNITPFLAQEVQQMNKTELVAAVAAEADLTKKDAEKFLSAFESVVTGALANDDKVSVKKILLRYKKI